MLTLALVANDFISQYLSPQATLAIGITFPLASLMTEKLSKPIIDAKVPSTELLHDYWVQGSTLLWDIGGVALFMWLFSAPGDARSIAWGIIGTIVSWLCSTQLYLTMRGNVPKTPTNAMITQMAKDHRLALHRAPPPPDQPAL